MQRAVRFNLEKLSIYHVTWRIVLHFNCSCSPALESTYNVELSSHHVVFGFLASECAIAVRSFHGLIIADQVEALFFVISP